MALNISHIFQVCWPRRTQTQETVFLLLAGHYFSGYKNNDDSLQHCPFFLMGHNSSRGNYGHPRHCNYFQVVAAQVRLLIQQQLAVEHRQSGIEVCGCSLDIQCGILYKENMHMNWISEDFLHLVEAQHETCTRMLVILFVTGWQTLSFSILPFKFDF